MGNAPTVVSAFKTGVALFDLSENVRSVHEGENIEVWRYMLEAHNNDAWCVVTGSSTHNERIERLWRDVLQSIAHFAEMFQKLEREEILDTLNEVDVFALHYVYLPTLNRCLQELLEQSHTVI